MDVSQDGSVYKMVAANIIFQTRKVKKMFGL